jgi:tRNA nucleotidyltransferase/poly(A) polymerase
MAGPTLSEKYQQTHDELQNMLTMLSRIDERVGIFIDKQKESEIRLNDHIENCPARNQLLELANKVAIMELEVKKIGSLGDKIINLDIEQKQQNINIKHQEKKWNGVGSFAFQTILNLLWVVLAALILYWIGLSPP